MLKLLINITDLLKKLGFFSVVLLPAVALILVAAAFYVCSLGIVEILKGISNNIFCLREKKKLYKSIAESFNNYTNGKRDEKENMANSGGDCGR